MQSFVIAGAALALGIFAAPSVAQPLPQWSASAQPTGPNEPASPTTQSMPDGPQAQPLPEPPPFPPMPRARPTHRFTSSGQHRTSHAAHRTTHIEHRTTRVQHGTTRAHHAAADARHRRTHARHETSKKRHQAVKLSRKSIRYCHALTYTRIMRNSSCRALMSQELEAASDRHHHTTHRHKAKHSDRSTRTHKAAKARARHSRRHRS